MCGITGIFLFSDQKTDKLAKVTQSNESLVLRGPDSGNVFVTNCAGLGHRRLSIIDTTSAAAQPMEDVTKRYTIVFNGEIYNFQHLFQQYLIKDWFAQTGKTDTHSDTEVLLYLLIKFGIDCLSWLDGFFAFSFYDQQARTMLLARDSYGKKPLIYYHCPDYFAFASEMKALLAYDIPRKLNYSVLHQYLQLNYIPQPQSMLEGVEKLKPGHYLRIDMNGIQEYAAYYTIKIQPEKYSKYSYQEAQQELVERMDIAVRERMIADVSLGAFLSGGIDSSVIVALASRYVSQLNTFSIGYKDNPYFDETNYAQLVANKYNTNHTVFSLTNDDFLEHVFDVLDYLDEPFGDSSAIPVYILSKNTRKYVTVALSGDGGDEVFAGYNKHGAEWKIRQKSWAKSVVSAAYPLWNALPRSRNNKITNKFRQFHRFAEGTKLDQRERYWRWASFTTELQVNDLLLTKTKNLIDRQLIDTQKSVILSALKTDDYNEVLLTDMNLVLLSDMLVKVDLMSMANSLEVRSPFLDHKLVDFAFGLPSEYKIDGNLKKKVVQDAFRPMLPQEIYNRPKHGFEIPLLDWFRNELWGLINDNLLSRKFVSEQGIFNPDSIEALKKKLRSSNPEDSHATIWALIVFQYWWKKYLA